MPDSPATDIFTTLLTSGDSERGGLVLRLLMDKLQELTSESKQNSKDIQETSRTIAATATRMEAVVAALSKEMSGDIGKHSERLVSAEGRIFAAEHAIEKLTDDVQKNLADAKAEMKSEVRRLEQGAKENSKGTWQWVTLLGTLLAIAVSIFTALHH